MIDRGAVQDWAGRCKLAVDARRRRLGNGTRLGGGPGASLEFHDHRPYLPGDDLRHLDWGVLARTDQLLLRRYRIETAPRVEVLLDASASLGIDPRKTALACECLLLLALLSRGDGARCAIWVATDRWQRYEPQGLEARLDTLTPTGAAGFEALPGPALMPGAQRILIGDGLNPGGGPALVARLGREAGQVSLIQILTPEEQNPAAWGPVILADVEGGEQEVVRDQALVTAYRERLARHLAGWDQALGGRGAGMMRCSTAEGLDGAVAAMTSAGLVHP